MEPNSYEGWWVEYKLDGVTVFEGIAESDNGTWVDIRQTDGRLDSALRVHCYPDPT